MHICLSLVFLKAENWLFVLTREFLEEAVTFRTKTVGEVPLFVVEVPPVEEKFMFVWIGLNEVFDSVVIGFDKVGDGFRLFVTFITELSLEILLGVEDAK